MELYKVLTREGEKLISPFQYYEYEPGKEYICENFDTSLRRKCSIGFYATDIEGLVYSFRNLSNYEIWNCEVGGCSVEIDQFKRRYERIKLIRQVPLEEVRALAKAEEERVGYKLAEALFPVNPFLLSAKAVTEEEMELVKKWGSVWGPIRSSVWDSVRGSVWNSVWSSVWGSVWDSVWDSIWDSVWCSVWDSVLGPIRGLVRDSIWNSVMGSVMGSILAYTSSLFPNIKKWKYIEHPEGENPFQPCIDLWHRGLVPSFDGKVWRIHAGKKAEVVWEGEDVTG